MVLCTGSQFPDGMDVVHLRLSLGVDIATVSQVRAHVEVPQLQVGVAIDDLLRRCLRQRFHTWMDDD